MKLDLEQESKVRVAVLACEELERVLISLPTEHMIFPEYCVLQSIIAGCGIVSRRGRELVRV